MTTLAEVSVELWLLDAAAPPADLLDLRCLDEDELRRSERFAREPDRVCYLTAHLALRRILARRLAVPPESLVFAREACPGCGGPHGRPRLAAHDAPHFSLSHGGGLVLVAVADVPVGADVEPVPTGATADELSAVLHPAEQAELAAAAPRDRPGEFARLWTRKEAYLKGLGIGLGRPPSADYLGTTGRHRRPSGWAVTDVPVGPRHAAAVAVATAAAEPAVRLRLHHALD